MLVWTTVALAADLSAVGFMEGCWRSETDGVVQQECWSPAQGGLMLGTHVDAKGDTAGFFEFLRVETGAEGLVYVAQPGGGAPTRFPMVSHGKGRVRFENPEHDFPKFIEYRLTDGALTATVGAGEKRSTWRWERVIDGSQGQR